MVAKEVKTNNFFIKRRRLLFESNILLKAVYEAFVPILTGRHKQVIDRRISNRQLENSSKEANEQVFQIDLEQGLGTIELHQ